MCELYNKLMGMIEGAPAANHSILTAYMDGMCNIGMHYDKMHSLLRNTIISVLKLGGESRRFCLRERIKVFPPGLSTAQKQKLQDAKPMLFDEVVASGDLIMMTSKANFDTQHGVPELENAEAVGLTGSIVWRTVTKRLTAEELTAQMRSTEKGRAKRKAKKDEEARSNSRRKSKRKV